MPHTYIRARDGLPVPYAEAIASDGKLRDGYRFGALQSGEAVTFDVMMMDGAAGSLTRVPLVDADAEALFRDSPEGREYLARRRQAFELAHPIGSMAKWTASAEASAVRDGLIEREAEQRSASSRGAFATAAQVGQATAATLHADAKRRRTA